MIDEGAQEGSKGRSQRPPIGVVTIVLLALLVALLTYRWLTPPAASVPATPRAGAPASISVPSTARPAAPAKTSVPSTALPGAEQALAPLLAQRTEELGIKPKRVVMPSDLALEATVAIKNGNYARAEQISEDVLTGSRLQSWRFYPFNEFMGSVVRGDDPVLLEHMNMWLAQQPDSALAYLFRAQYYQEAGWAARGGEARADLQRSISLNPKIPLTYYELLSVASSNGGSQDVEHVFQSAIKAFPNYYPLYKTRLRSLAPNRGGSVNAMYAFVERYADAAPGNSPLKLLYLDLYANVLEASAYDCNSYSGDARHLCVRALFWFRSRRGLDDRMESALNLYKTSDPIQFSTAVWPLLETISCDRCIGAPAVVGRVLQLAASIMGSDNRMMDEPTHNSYVLDDITARVWAQMGNSANADKKFHEALRDVERTSFPNEAEKAEATATVLDHMAAFADDTSQFVDIIVYHDAANAAGGINHTAIPYRKCYAYYRMKYFAAAANECTALIEGNGNYMQTHYWRGKAYEGLGQWDASIEDFTPVADSADNWFRVGAALDMSYDFGQKGDFAGQLASMNRYPYLFDPGLQPPHDLAVAYNNRCFAYMKLGQLKEALDDCTMSLKFDRIPDAFQKQQELLKLMGTNTS
jgi:tetratricopeptide (TPR) repeat protein